MKKLILLLVIFATLYIVAVFQFPELTDKMGLSDINNQIRDGKDTYDNVVTDIPTKNEVVDTYGQAFSWAVDIGNTIKWKIDITKDKIDTVRGTLWEAEQKYNDIKQTVEETKQFIDTTSEKIEEIKWTVEKVSEISDKIWEVTDVFSSWSTSN